MARREACFGNRSEVRVRVMKHFFFVGFFPGRDCPHVLRSLDFLDFPLQCCCPFFTKSKTESDSDVAKKKNAKVPRGLSGLEER